jgi:hypothetical protein
MSIAIDDSPTVRAQRSDVDRRAIALAGHVLNGRDLDEASIQGSAWSTDPLTQTNRSTGQPFYNTTEKRETHEKSSHHHCHCRIISRRDRGRYRHCRYRRRFDRASFDCHHVDDSHPLPDGSYT